MKYNNLVAYGDGLHGVRTILALNGLNIGNQNVGSYNRVFISNVSVSGTVYGEYNDIDYGADTSYGEYNEMNTSSTSNAWYMVSTTKLKDPERK